MFGKRKDDSVVLVPTLASLEADLLILKKALAPEAPEVPVPVAPVPVVPEAPVPVSMEQMQKDAYVMQNILKAHNINFDLEAFDQSKLTVKDGIVVGDVGYKPLVDPVSLPIFAPPQLAMTMEQVAQMTPEQINDNWEMVSSALESQNN